MPVAGRRSIGHRQESQEGLVAAMSLAAQTMTIESVIMVMVLLLALSLFAIVRTPSVDPSSTAGDAGTGLAVAVSPVPGRPADVRPGRRYQGRHSPGYVARQRTAQGPPWAPAGRPVSDQRSDRTAAEQ
jgi:hypothetical protein